MSKAQATNTSETTTPKTGPVFQAVPVDISKPAIKKAIADGKALIAEGKTKADAARAMYPQISTCLLYTSPSPRDVEESRMPSSA